jgi:hypothetical protein
MGRLRLAIPAVAIAAASACTPFVNIVSPTHGSTQTGASTHVVLDVSEGADAPDVVEAQLDGQAINLSESHEATVEGVLTNGQHTVTATASNADGSDSATSTFTVDNPLVPGSVLVLGDSINEQAFDPLATGQSSTGRTWYPNGNAPAGDYHYAIYRGWGTFTPEVIQAVADEVNALRPEVLVLPFGTNEASTLFAPGWTQADIDSYNQLLNSIHDNTWVVFVLPGHGVVAADQPQWVHDWAANIDVAHQDILDIATARPNSVVVDWQVFIDAHPELISPDSIHLMPADGSSDEIGMLTPVVPEAANLRQDIQWDGVTLARQRMAEGA